MLGRLRQLGPPRPCPHQWALGNGQDEGMADGRGTVDRAALGYGRGEELQGDLRRGRDLGDHLEIGSCSKDLLLRRGNKADASHQDTCSLVMLPVGHQGCGG